MWFGTQHEWLRIESEWQGIVFANYLCSEQFDGFMVKSPYTSLTQRHINTSDKSLHGWEKTKCSLLSLQYVINISYIVVFIYKEV